MTSDTAPKNERALRSDALANRGSILVAARRVFATQGLDATLAQVAKCAGVGVGTIYRNFGGKDELIEHLFTSRLEVVTAVVDTAVAMDDAWAGLMYFLTESTKMMAEDRGLRALVGPGSAGAYGASGQSSRTHFSDTVDAARIYINRQTVVLIERAKASGVLRPDFEATDLPVLTQSVQAAADFASAESPDLWKRMLVFAVDGLRASRDRPTASEVDALTEPELYAAMARFHGVRRN